MSIKTTHTTTRELALQFIESKLSELSNDQLADVLETTVHNGFYNFTIEDREEDLGDWCVIRSLEQFPEPNDAY